MSQIQLFLLPIFLHVVLVFFVAKRMVDARVAAVRSGTTKLSDIATNSGAWPDQVRKIGANFDNQFDLPTTWYAASALIIATGKLDWVCVVFAWAFLLARLAHAYIHIGSNHVRSRMRAYQAGFATMVVMWVWFAVRLFIIG